MNEPDSPAINLKLLNPALIEAGLPGSVRSYASHYLGRFSNDVWRLDLNNGIRLVAKQAYRQVPKNNAADHEREFYHMLGRQDDLPVPRFITEIEETLLLEYQPLQAFNFRSGATRDHAERAIDALADWHAAWWARPPVTDWLQNYAERRVRQKIQKNYDQAWLAQGSRLLKYAPEFEQIGNALLGQLTETLLPMSESSTLIHGDAHAENLPLSETGEVLILDWQEPAIANPGLDLAVFTTMSFRPSDRRALERELVARHARRLAAHGCQWSNPWDAYRLGLLRRAARIVEISSQDFSSLPWVFERTARAALEHQVGDLISQS